MVLETFLVVQWLGLLLSSGEAIGSIPGQGTRIPHACGGQPKNFLKQ